MAKTDKQSKKTQAVQDKIEASPRKEKKPARDVQELMGFIRAVPIILVAVALFITLCFITGETGAFGSFISRVLKGLFSYMAYTIPLFILIHALTFASDFKERRLLARFVYTFVSLVMLSMIAFIIPNIGGEEVVFDAATFYNDGIASVGGGFIGGGLALLLTKLVGYIGLLIIIAVVFVIFVVLTFYGNGKGFTLFILKKLAAAADKGAKMEERAHDKKSKKIKEKAAKARAADEKKNAKFYDDDFFYTDNGVSTLEIPELGIVETKDNAGYVLRETVAHGEEDEAEEVKAPEEQIKRTVSTDYAENIANSNDENKYREDDIVISVQPEDIPEEKPAPEEASPKKLTLDDLGIDRSADSVFTDSFDPYDLALNQKYASKVSSRAKETLSSEETKYTESIANLTPEEAERLERLRKFEACKAAAMKRKEEAEAAERAEEAAKETEAPAEVTPVIAPPTIASEEEAEVSDAPEEVIAANDDTDSDSKADEKPFVPVSQITVDYNNQYGEVKDTSRSGGYRFVAGVANDEERIPYAASDPKVNYNTADTATSAAYGSVARTVAINDQPAAEIGAAPKTPRYEFIVEEPAPKETYAPITDEPIAPKTFAPMAEEPKASPAFTPVSEAPVYSAASAPATETTVYTAPASPAEDDAEEEEQECGTIEITREQIGSFGEERRSGLDFSEEEEEEEESFSDEDAEDAAPMEEIPEEEQNPVISDYRGMFDIFKDDKNDAETEEENAEEEIGSEEDESPLYENDEEESIDESSDIGEDATDEDIEVDEDDIPYDDEDDDLPPFDEPKVVSKPAEKEVKKPLVPDYSNYKFPPIDLLKKGQAEDYSKISDELQESSERLIGALAAFNITATVRAMERGPRITRYSIVPAKGVRVNQIERLSDDIALAMAAESIRIEAPIPGKSAVGVEVPNKIPSLVSLRDLLESDEFVNDKSKTVVCVGKSVEGSLVFGDISTMPHLLIAGATGMGKSVCMNALITSILYKARPDEVKFIMIDPKKVEFAPYNGIPHLLVPVVTDPKQAAGTLMWAVDEMNKRYDIIEKLCVRGIDSYNQKVAENPELGAPMPKIVILIDELNDLMIQVRDPVENLIMLIAQKARAAGIHLVIGTQRPSVNVITGVIKANIPSRIACKVSSGIDSRTILEQTGAEKLIGKGDMLFAPGGKPNPQRVQGAYVSESETASIVDFVKSQVKGGVMYDEQAMEDMKRAAQKCDKNKNEGGDFEEEEESGVGYLHDRKFLDAVELAIRNGSVATSFLQRKLRIGYGKAAQYIDIMEDLGIVGEKNGSKPRDILVSMAEWNERRSRLTLDD